MKVLIFSVVFLSAYSAYGAKVKIGVNEMLLLSSGVGDKFFHYILRKDELSSVPSWDGVGEPPLNTKDVTSLVLSKHKKLNGNIESKVKKVSLKSKETFCSPEQKCPKTLWYYKVKVRGEKRATYVVLINGEFVEPRI
jgi:hypothetical protein